LLSDQVDEFFLALLGLGFLAFGPSLKNLFSAAEERGFPL
jgi:hypothetical protein